MGGCCVSALIFSHAAAATQVPVFTFTECLLASLAIEKENPGVTAKRQRGHSGGWFYLFVSSRGCFVTLVSLI